MKKIFKVKKIFILMTMASLAVGCMVFRPSQSISPCFVKIPRDVKGLIIKGPRPRRNVIENMVPIICAWQEKIDRDKRSGLTGEIVLRLTVNKVGEIFVRGFEHTAQDASYVQMLVESICNYDFDPWNDEPFDTEITYPINLP
ncbi:MAG: hypothetical protein JW795_02950 [Chitinivibrionales bacterium]|nr:hypothetical protein [Chitinivibrionales bacterium]